MELNPLVDPGYTTVLNANRLVQECLTGIAMRKTGITDGHGRIPDFPEQCVGKDGL